jgi:hypothetical protein
MLKRFYFSGLIISIFSFLVFIGCEKKGTESKPDFTIKITPLSRSLAQGDSTNFSVKILPIEGFNSEVTLSLTGLPAGGSAIFEDSILSPSDSTLLWIKTTPSIAVRTDTLTLTASGGGKSHTSNLSLTVIPKLSELKLYFKQVSGVRKLADSPGFSILQDEINDTSFTWSGFIMNQNFSFDTAQIYLYLSTRRENPTPAAIVHMQIRSENDTIYDGDIYYKAEGPTWLLSIWKDTLDLEFAPSRTLKNQDEIEITLKATGFTFCVFKYGDADTTFYNSYVKCY